MLMIIMMMIMMMMIMAMAKFELFRGHFLKESAIHFTLFLNLERTVH